MFTWTCLICDESGDGETNDDAIAAWQNHHDAEHEGLPNSFAVRDDDDDPLQRTRDGMAAMVASMLAGTDKWAARAYEDGVPLSDARKAYRQALRAAYQQIATSDDPESIELPEPPAAE